MEYQVNFGLVQEEFSQWGLRKMKRKGGCICALSEHCNSNNHQCICQRVKYYKCKSTLHKCACLFVGRSKCLGKQQHSCACHVNGPVRCIIDCMPNFHKCICHIDPSVCIGMLHVASKRDVLVNLEVLRELITKSYGDTVAQCAYYVQRLVLTV